MSEPGNLYGLLAEAWYEAEQKLVTHRLVLSSLREAGIWLQQASPRARAAYRDLLLWQRAHYAAVEEAGTCDWDAISVGLCPRRRRVSKETQAALYGLDVWLELMGRVSAPANN